LESCKRDENMELTMLGAMGMHVFMKKKQRSLFDESQFDSQLSQLPQLINQCLTGRSIR
jgi:hypothetical protein